MPVTVACACGARFAANDQLIGKTVACPACKQPLAIRAPTAPGAKPAPAARPAPARAPAPRPAAPAHDPLGPLGAADPLAAFGAMDFGSLGNAGPVAGDPLAMGGPASPLGAGLPGDPLGGGFDPLAVRPSLPHAMGAAPGQSTAGGGGQTLLFVGIGAGALVLVGIVVGVVFAFSGGSKPVAVNPPPIVPPGTVAPIPPGPTLPGPTTGPTPVTTPGANPTPGTTPTPSPGTSPAPVPPGTPPTIPNTTPGLPANPGTTGVSPTPMPPGTIPPPGASPALGIPPAIPPTPGNPMPSGNPAPGNPAPSDPMPPATGAPTPPATGVFLASRLPGEVVRSTDGKVAVNLPGAPGEAKKATVAGAECVVREFVSPDAGTFVYADYQVPEGKTPREFIDAILSEPAPGRKAVGAQSQDFSLEARPSFELRFGSGATSTRVRILGHGSSVHVLLCQGTAAQVEAPAAQAFFRSFRAAP